MVLPGGVDQKRVCFCACFIPRVAVYPAAGYESTTNFITIERFELPKVTKSYQKLRIISYRLDKNRMFTNGFETLNTLFLIKSITDVL